LEAASAVTAIHPSDTQIFARRTVPHRSLDRRGFHRLLMVFAGFSFCVTLPFVIMGAWPVAGFMGVDVLIFYFAFRANFRAANAYEDVTVTPVLLHIERVSHRGKRLEWRLNPLWVRLGRQEDGDFGLGHIRPGARGRALEGPARPGPEAREQYANELARALAEAKRGPRYN